ncbi:class I SAM-dependent methyltransferase [Chelativorans sp. YIM 93263]|uniref:class I SAM-dependent methyltransferase n=1 Tax=Chelativorans sp. YIM 93263 TaxID=2906648 RepID=UPI002378E98F|nr:methyltransferase [Chelativorans sp. YIM 93263]
MTGKLTPEGAEAFIRANTALRLPPHVPEIQLFLADEAHDLWQSTEEELQEMGLPPPFWAFAWAGGQGLARYVIDHPDSVRGRTVLDFATGSGLVAIAACMAGAARVRASDTDPFAQAACRLNMAANQVAFDFTASNLVGTEPGFETILAGDVFYDRALAEQLAPWFAELAAGGVTVLVGDPGRTYLPSERLTQLAVYSVPVTRALEDTEVKRTTVWRFT